MSKKDLKSSIEKSYPLRHRYPALLQYLHKPGGEDPFRKSPAEAEARQSQHGAHHGGGPRQYHRSRCNECLGIRPSGTAGHAILKTEIHRYKMTGFERHSDLRARAKIVISASDSMTTELEKFRNIGTVACKSMWRYLYGERGRRAGISSRSVSHHSLGIMILLCDILEYIKRIGITSSHFKLPIISN